MSWQTILGYGLAVVSIVATVYYATRRPRRRLAWEIISDQVLRRNSVGSSEHRFSGTPHQVTIRVSNKGREPIQRQDYDEPVAFICRALALRAWIGESSSKKLVPDAVIQEGRLSYAPILLNPREWFDLVGEYDDGMSGGRLHFYVYQGRITGIDEVEDWADRSARVNRYQTITGFVAGVLLIAASAFMISAAGLSVSSSAFALFGWAFSFAGVLVLLLALGLLGPGRLPNRHRRK